MINNYSQYKPFKLLEQKNI